METPMSPGEAMDATGPPRSHSDLDIQRHNEREEFPTMTAQPNKTVCLRRIPAVLTLLPKDAPASSARIMLSAYSNGAWAIGVDEDDGCCASLIYAPADWSADRLIRALLEDVPRAYQLHHLPQAPEWSASGEREEPA